MSNHTFFFSHARQDREIHITTGLMDEFFQDLEERLAQFVGVDLEQENLGTIDRDVAQGADWDRALSEPLGSKKAFVAIFTPRYFRRPDCGKELCGFLLRIVGLGIDTNGALTGVENVLPVRWLPKSAYTSNGETIIPTFLRLLNDRPSASRNNPQLLAAIELYKQKGMEGCVGNFPHYRELVDAIVDRIRHMPDLPSVNGIRFANLKNAFEYDWAAHFATAGAATVQAAPAVEEAPAVPEALSSVVVFYITRRTMTPSPKHVDFADRLIAEPLPGKADQTDPTFAALLADVRAACAAERLTVFHAAAKSAVPLSADALLARLTLLSGRRILAAICVDASIWPENAGSVEAGIVEQIIRSPQRAGLVLIASNPGAGDLSNLAARQALPPGVFELPPGSDARIAVLRQAFIGLRGTVLSTSTESAAGAERVPLLKSVGGGR